MVAVVEGKFYQGEFEGYVFAMQEQAYALRFIPTSCLALPSLGFVVFRIKLLTIRDWILENLPFWHIDWSDIIIHIS